MNWIAGNQLSDSKKNEIKGEPAVAPYGSQARRRRTATLGIEIRNMKTAAICVLLLGMLCSATTASVMILSIKGEGTNAVYSIRSKTFSESEMKRVLVKLHELDKDQIIYIAGSISNTMVEVAKLLGMIRDTGFEKVLISTPAARDGKLGTQFTSLHLEKAPDFAPSCVGEVRLTNGFLKDEIDLIEVIRCETNVAQPAHAGDGQARAR
jgi:hypothetical protein